MQHRHREDCDPGDARDKMTTRKGRRGGAAEGLERGVDPVPPVENLKGTARSLRNRDQDSHSQHRGLPRGASNQARAAREHLPLRHVNPRGASLCAKSLTPITPVTGHGLSLLREEFQRGLIFSVLLFFLLLRQDAVSPSGLSRRPICCPSFGPLWTHLLSFVPFADVRTARTCKHTRTRTHTLFYATNFTQYSIISSLSHILFLGVAHLKVFSQKRSL